MKPDNTSSANGPRRYADATPLQLALREMHTMAVTPRFWGVLLAVAIVLAIAAPFRTSEELTFPQLLAYWSAICVTTYFPATFVSMFVAVSLLQKGVAELPSWAAGGLAASFPVVAIILALNVFVVGFSGVGRPPLWVLTLQCGAISLAVVAVHYMLRPPARNAGEDETTPSPVNPLLERLPVSKRGPVLHMSMQDHYVQVTTTSGTELVLMRLADAIAAMPPEDGLQIHRSHWIAIAHVKAVDVAKGQRSVTMSDGTVLPVSRTHAPKLREMGLH